MNINKHLNGTYTFYPRPRASQSSVSFRRFPATRIRFTVGYPNSELYVFEEIILGEPDTE